ncbi:MAG TPA: CYCXC family (seleno)protein [Pyrinomonadaceae bacterium]|nr:CYCXC family (seleno)protein [Pyrinomonadaceae bacterium]
MKSKLLLIGMILGIAAAGACTARDDRQAVSSNRTTERPPVSQQASAPTAQTAATHDGHDHAAVNAADVPAFETSPSSLKYLPPTLSPDKFMGQQRIAYQMVKEIPQTIAQLPCYCHCDEGFGHKSLHSCFVDDHAAHCAVCVDEAVMAYNLQKEGKLKPEQIRERIIAHYGGAH